MTHYDWTWALALLFTSFVWFIWLSRASVSSFMKDNILVKPVYDKATQQPRRESMYTESSNKLFLSHHISI